MATDRQRLLSAARRMLISRADAEDAVQDTYVRALMAFPSMSSAPPAWLQTVLRNIVIDRLRRQQMEAGYAAAESPAGTSSESLLEVRAGCEDALRYLLARVSLEEAAAILLRDVFEFDYDEIGRIVGKSETASRQFLHRARTRARRGGEPADIDEPSVSLCWRAIEMREPALLMHLLQTTAAQAVARSPSLPEHSGRSFSRLVHVNGRYAIAWVLDGVVLCLVPVGAQARLKAETGNVL